MHPRYNNYIHTNSVLQIESLREDSDSLSDDDSALSGFSPLAGGGRPSPLNEGKPSPLSKLMRNDSQVN